MNIIEAAKALKEGKKVYDFRPDYPVMLDARGMVVFTDGYEPAVHVDDLLSETWKVVE